MESAPASECPAADRSDDVRCPVCNGIGLDGERKHKRLRGGAPRREQVGAGRRFIRVVAVLAPRSLTAGLLV